MTGTKHERIQKLAISAMFLAIGLVLPFLTGQIRQIGNMMLPMHLPVLLCGLICGWQYGLEIGLILPVLRYFLFGMPQLYPTAIAMSVELATYGLVVGLVYSHSRWQCVISLYRAMLIAMVSGRIVWGITMLLMLGVGENGFTWVAFTAGAFFNAIPGIVIQLVLIPAVMVALNRTGLVPFRRKEKKTGAPAEG